LTLSEIVKMLADITEIAVTILLAYVVYKIAALIETLNSKIKGEKTNNQRLRNHMSSRHLKYCVDGKLIALVQVCLRCGRKFPLRGDVNSVQVVKVFL